MIVDFPSIKAKLDKAIVDHLNFVLKREQSFLSQLKHRILHEGDGDWSYQTVDNEVFDGSLEKLTSAFNIPNDKIKSLKIQDMFQYVEDIAVDIAKQQKELSIRRMNEAVERVGNVIDSPNKKFAESSLEMLEKIHIEFDETRDKPSLPTMIVHPQTAEKLKREEQSMTLEEKLSYEKRQEEILNRKYEEYVLRESNRKLVD